MSEPSTPEGSVEQADSGTELTQHDTNLSVICPTCGGLNLLVPTLTTCTECKGTFVNKNGIFDLVRNPSLKDEREFYDTTYSNARPENTVNIDWSLLEEHWARPDFPERQIVMEKLGDLKGKSVLLLGNGNSDKELLFLRGEPSILVYSDLSVEALICMRARYLLDVGEGVIKYVSVDAQDIGFAPSSFDIVYGYAMVHHLPDLPEFFKSVERVLKPGGKAVFMDDAYAPLWHRSKQTWLKPLMKYSHAKTGISPEDLRFSMTGGFKEAELTKQIEEIDCRPWFERTSLLAYIVPRGLEKLAAPSLLRKFRSGGLGRSMVRLDAALARIGYFRRNQIRLVWGFTKPSSS